MTSFRSKHYPKSGKAFAIIQEYAMPWYGIFTFAVMAICILGLYEQHNILWWAIFGETAAVILANLFALITIKRKWAQIFFINEQFSMLSVHDILYNVPQSSFPLKFANPAREGDKITLHFQDQIVVLEQSNWDDFDLIWNWLNHQ